MELGESCFSLFLLVWVNCCACQSPCSHMPRQINRALLMIVSHQSLHTQFNPCSFPSFWSSDYHHHHPTGLLQLPLQRALWRISVPQNHMLVMMTSRKTHTGTSLQQHLPTAVARLRQPLTPAAPCMHQQTLKELLLP